MNTKELPINRIHETVEDTCKRNPNGATFVQILFECERLGNCSPRNLEDVIVWMEQNEELECTRRPMDRAGRTYRLSV